MLVAKHAAVVDQLSGGRLTLGIAQGGRQDDFELFGVSFVGRSARFEQQVTRIREIWREARGSDRDYGAVGPAPVQDPGPPIWAGALQPKAIERAARVADGFIFGTAGLGGGRPGIREASRHRASRTRSSPASPTSPWGRNRSRRSTRPRTTSFATTRLWTEPDNLIHHGPATKIAEEVAAYADAIDVLILFPQIPHLDQVEQLAKHVLPAYR